MNNHIKVEYRTQDDIYSLVFFQVASEGTEDRKVIDILLDAPSGDVYRVEVVSNGKTLTFEVGAVQVSDIVKVYNGVRLRKSA